MGAVTAVVDADGFTPMDGSNAGYMVRCKITMSSSYATGGDTIAAGVVNLGLITKLAMSGTSDGGAGVTTSYIASPVYDSTGTYVTNIQVFLGAAVNGAFVEVASTTNLSTRTFDCIAFGT